MDGNFVYKVKIESAVIIFRCLYSHSGPSFTHPLPLPLSVHTHKHNSLTIESVDDMVSFSACVFLFIATHYLGMTMFS